MAKKNKLKRDFGKVISITNINPGVHDDITNIAANQGISRGDFLKPYLRNIANEYPPQMKQPPQKD
jgi:hypothetical protein